MHRFLCSKLYVCIFSFYFIRNYIILASSNKIGHIVSARKIAQIPGNIIIGGLFPIHKEPTIKTTFSRQCGEIREQYGMHRVEAFIKTINEINKNPHLLKNITLGVDIRDTCWYAPVALEQSIDFIRNSLAHLDRVGQGKQSSTNSKAQPFRDSGAECSLAAGTPIAALIGPGSSSVTIQVQNLMQLFKIPQIGYSATSIDLSKKDEYRYFMRVVPPDRLQARVLVDLVNGQDWKFISLLSSKGKHNYVQILNHATKSTNEYIGYINIEPNFS